jgi:hypothetical protein
LSNGQNGAEYKRKLNISEGYTPYYKVVLGYKDVRMTNEPERIIIQFLTLFYTCESVLCSGICNVRKRASQNVEILYLACNVG